MELTASWIWSDADPRAYNQACAFEKAVRVPPGTRAARLAYSADTVARIFIDGHWVADGPCRGWPHAYHYDVLDVTALLTAGDHRLGAVVRYHGVGTFHQIPQRAGFLLQLELQGEDGAWQTAAVTDESWSVRPYLPWRRSTPKVSIQMGPAEWIDAREGEGEPRPATVLAPAGPFGTLRPRDVALQGRYEVTIPPPASMRVVRPAAALPWAIPVTRLCHPGMIATNINTSRGMAVATIIHADSALAVPWASPDWIGFANGRRLESSLELRRGPNAVIAFVRKFFEHKFEATFDEPAGRGTRPENPLDPTAAFAWCVVLLRQFDWVESDLHWLSPPRPDRADVVERYERFVEQSGPAATASADALRDWARAHGGRVASREEVACEDPHAAFERREPIRELSTAGAAFPLVLQPQREGDVELHIDLGDQYCGYASLDVEAPEDAVLDHFLVENVAADARVQHTAGNRNGFRYICRGGRQSHRSLLRRSGRHLFLTARNLTGPLTVHGLGLTESRYPARVVGSFRCSDDRLNRLWDAARRTMELSMDDVYLDSLYEQTLWVGDLQTEQLYGLWTFDARDISLRSLRLAAQSLDRLPMIGAQVPSSWEMLLSAWSFLWGIAVWDYYDYTGEREALAELWPAVRQNLVAAETYLNERGLFDAAFWNLLDWAPIEQNHRCVLHNSMLMVGATDAAIRCAEVLDLPDDAARLRCLRGRVADAINAAYQPERGGYPDALNAVGQYVGFSQHPQFLSLLFNVAPADRVPDLLRLLHTPPPGIVQPGSPFALHFLYGTLEKCGRADLVVPAMLRDYAPLLEAKATTLWEMLPKSGDSPSGWPTRSHCHGWSACPIYYLPRVVLGIRAVAPGAVAFEIGPCLGDLDWAEGAVATPRGPLHVRVERRDGRPHVRTVAPPEVRVTVVTEAAANG